MVPFPLEDGVGDGRRRVPVQRLTAVTMYERLKRMSIEHGLKLSPEDLLVSAYMGHNLVYSSQPAGFGGEPQPEGRDGRRSPLSARST